MIASVLAQHATTVLADGGGLVGLVTNLEHDGTTIALTGGSLLGVVFVLKHLVESFTVVRLLTALGLAAVMVWGIFHLNDLSRATGNTIKKDTNGAIEMLVPAPDQPDIHILGRV